MSRLNRHNGPKLASFAQCTACINRRWKDRTINEMSIWRATSVEPCLSCGKKTSFRFDIFGANTYWCCNQCFKVSMVYFQTINEDWDSGKIGGKCDGCGEMTKRVSRIDIKQPIEARFHGSRAQVLDDNPLHTFSKTHPQEEENMTTALNFEIKTVKTIDGYKGQITTTISTGDAQASDEDHVRILWEGRDSHDKAQDAIEDAVEHLADLLNAR